MRIIKVLAAIKKLMDFMPTIMEFIDKLLKEIDQFKINKVK